MAANVNKWDKTAANNDNSDGDINFLENQAPGTLNNSSRGVMEGVARDRDDKWGGLTTGGSATAYTVASTNSSNADAEVLRDGFGIMVEWHAANTGTTPTLQIDGGTAKTLTKSSGAALVAGDLPIGQRDFVTYNAGTGKFEVVGERPSTVVTASTSVSGKSEHATAAEFRANSSNVRSLESNEVWDSLAEVALTSSSNAVAWDMSLGIDFDIDTLGENTTVAAPSNTTVGKKGRMRIVQDGTGSRTVAWNAVFKIAGGGTITAASTGAGDVDLFYYDVISATFILIVPVLDVD